MRGPTSKRACSEPSATASAALNFQFAWCDCTISKPGASQSTHSNNWASEGLAGGVAAMPNTISGSSRGWHSAPTANDPWPSQVCSVVCHTLPQIGANTP